MSLSGTLASLASVLGAGDYIGAKAFAGEWASRVATPSNLQEAARPHGGVVAVRPATLQEHLDCQVVRGTPHAAVARWERVKRSFVLDLPFPVPFQRAAWKCTTCLGESTRLRLLGSAANGNTAIRWAAAV